MNRKLLFCILFLFVGVAAFAQSISFENILKNLGKSGISSPTEKVHLHLDKPFYAAGEDIWFKAYVIDAGTSLPSLHSNVLIVELMGPDGTLKMQHFLPIMSGLAFGNLSLSDVLSEGNYRIRAYTRLMQNYSPEFFFDQPIKVGNFWNNDVFTTSKFSLNTENLLSATIQFLNKNKTPYVGKTVNYTIQGNSDKTGSGTITTDQSGRISLPAFSLDTSKNRTINVAINISPNQHVEKIIPIQMLSSAIDVQFLPEGGKLVNGLPSKVAIKAVDKNGMGVAISGKIIDNEGLEVSSFELGDMGMGVFFMNPIAGKMYRAVFRLPNGSENIVHLPDASSQGYVLSVNNSDSLKFTVKTFISSEMQNKGTLHLVAQHSGQVMFSTEIPTAKPMAALSLLKSNFPSGIIQLTLFSPENIPVAERIIFIQNASQKIDVSVQGLQQTYAPLSPVQFSILATNQSVPVPASFSVSVTNSTLITPDEENESNILTDLLLTSDLTGYVQNPNRYFLSNNVATREDLDALMLTQGWRKISWEALATNSIPVPQFEPEKALHISGRITTTAGNPIVGGKLSLFSYKSMLALDTLSDSNGQFNFDRLQFNDSTKFVLQAKSLDKKNLRISIDRIPQPSIPSIDLYFSTVMDVNKDIAPYLKKSAEYLDDLVRSGKIKKSGIDIESVEIEGKRRNLASPNSSNYNLSGKADQVVTAKELEHVFSLGAYIQQGRMRSVFMQDGLPISTRFVSLADAGFKTNDFGNVVSSKLPMEVIYNGMRVSPSIIEFIPVEEIESVEVITNMSGMLMYGVSDGIIIITSKSVGITGIPDSIAGLITFKPKGFSVSKEFYVPGYVQKQQKDLRTTVFWKPMLTTDKSGKATLEFPNTSQVGTHRMVIEGIDADGNLARKVATYVVQ